MHVEPVGLEAGLGHENGVAADGARAPSRRSHAHLTGPFVQRGSQSMISPCPPIKSQVVYTRTPWIIIWKPRWPSTGVGAG